MRYDDGSVTLWCDDHHDHVMSLEYASRLAGTPCCWCGKPISRRERTSWQPVVDAPAPQEPPVQRIARLTPKPKPAPVMVTEPPEITPLLVCSKCGQAEPCRCERRRSYCRITSYSPVARERAG